MNRVAIIVLLSASLAFPLASGAATVDCKNHEVTKISGQNLIIPTPVGTYYLEERDDGRYLYEETNARAGLQRGGDATYFEGKDVCVDDKNIPHDQLVM